MRASYSLYKNEKQKTCVIHFLILFERFDALFEIIQRTNIFNLKTQQAEMHIPLNNEEHMHLMDFTLYEHYILHCTKSSHIIKSRRKCLATAKSFFWSSLKYPHYSKYCNGFTINDSRNIRTVFNRLALALFNIAISYLHCNLRF